MSLTHRAHCLTQWECFAGFGSVLNAFRDKLAYDASTAEELGFGLES